MKRGRRAGRAASDRVDNRAWTFGRSRRLVSAFAILAATTVASATAATGPATIRITNVQKSLIYVDLGHREDGAGNLTIITQSLYNRRISNEPIGHAGILCTLVNSTTWSCVATYVLPRGTIVTSGIIGNRLIYEVAIIGGTELYDNARGSLVVTTTALNPRRQVLLFRLVG
jgi:hypothetical protein